MADEVDDLETERLLAIGIAVTQGHAFSATGTRQEDWMPGPNTFAMARERLAAYSRE